MQIVTNALSGDGCLFSPSFGLSLRVPPLPSSAHTLGLGDRSAQEDSGAPGQFRTKLWVWCGGRQLPNSYQAAAGGVRHVVTSMVTSSASAPSPQSLGITLAARQAYSSRFYDTLIGLSHMHCGTGVRRPSRRWRGRTVSRPNENRFLHIIASRPRSGAWSATQEAKNHAMPPLSSNLKQ